MPQFRREDIVLRFGGDDTLLGKTIARIRKRTEGLRHHLSGIGESIRGFFGVKLAGGIGAVAASFTALTKSALESADALAKTADKVGVGVEDLQRLRHAAEASGVAQGQLDTALQRFSRRIAEAAQGTGVLYKELDRLGIRVRDSQGNMRETVDILGDYANAVQRAESSQEQLRLAFVAFDSEGAALVNLLRQGKIGMQELMQTADELGIVLDESLVRHSEELNQQWSDFTGRLWIRFQRTVLGAARLLDQLAGNYRTLADVSARVLEIEREIAEEQRTTGRRDTIIRLERELKALKERQRVLQAIADLEKEIRNQPGPAGTPSPVTGGTTTTTTGSSGGGGFTQEPIDLSHSLALQHQALQAFRAGGTQAELVAALAQIEYLRGLITQQQAEGRAAEALVAYGPTEGDVNLTGPGPGDQITVQLGPDKQYLNEQFQKWAEENEIEVKFKVNPELLSLDLVYQTPADQMGAQE